MRIFSVFLFLIAFMLFTPLRTFAQEIKDTNLNTESADQSNTATLNNEITIDKIPTQTELLTTDEKKVEKILSQWKKKQTDKWASLPSDDFTINASAYTAAFDETDSGKGITASGIHVVENRTLACPPSFPFGAKIQIDTVGIRICEDRGGAIKGNHFDIYMVTKKEAFTFGRRNLIARVVE